MKTLYTTSAPKTPSFLLGLVLAFGMLLAPAASQAHRLAQPQSYAISAAAAEGNVQVKIDGQEVSVTEELVLEKDQIYKLEVVGLKPNSKVEFAFKKAGIKVYGADHKVNDKGTISEIIETPESGGGVQCIISYVSAAGTSHEIKFKIKLT